MYIVDRALLSRQFVPLCTQEGLGSFDVGVVSDVLEVRVSLVGYDGGFVERLFFFFLRVGDRGGRARCLHP